MNAKKTKYPSENCDESCYYHCTKGGQQEPECVVIKNNGWIRIDSESDLPNKDKTMYHVSKDKRVFNSPVNQGTVLKWWYSNKITHYQQIVKPNPPIC